MKKKTKFTLSIALVLILSFSLFAPAFAALEGFSDGYIEISSLEDLENIRNNLDGKYKLTSDIDLSSTANWKPIGNSDYPFTGEFNGNGHSIDNLTIKREPDSEKNFSDLAIGIFGLVKDAKVVNLNITNVDIYINCENAFFSIGTVAGTTYNSQIHGCSSNGNISLTNYNYDASYIGGIVGFLSENTVISDCINNTNIKMTQLEKEEPENDFSFGFPTFSSSGIGGISGGGFRTTLSECINYGTITADMIGIGCFGGIVGLFDDRIITDCGNVGDITITGNGKNIGGICGASNSIKNCYNAGIITSNCSLEKIGAISGTATDNAEFTNCYYNNQMVDAVSNPEDCVFNNVKSVSIEEMKSQNTYTGFDFKNIWIMSEESYPTPIHKINLVSAEIIKIPFSGRITFGNNTSPEGIIIKLKYSDGSEKIEEIIKCENTYYVADKTVNFTHSADKEYGLLSAKLIIDNSNIELSYNYFAFPAIISIIIETIMSFFH